MRWVSMLKPVHENVHIKIKNNTRMWNCMNKCGMRKVYIKRWKLFMNDQNPPCVSQ